MGLCDICEKGKLEMCKYFREHFWRSGNQNVTKCPEFEVEEDLRDLDFKDFLSELEERFT